MSPAIMPPPWAYRTADPGAGPSFAHQRAATLEPSFVVMECAVMVTVGVGWNIDSIAARMELLASLRAFQSPRAALVSGASWPAIASIATAISGSSVNAMFGTSVGQGAAAAGGGCRRVCKGRNGEAGAVDAKRWARGPMALSSGSRPGVRGGP